jgi:septal ring factor EnvC (AmiA/AmiB activator)
MLRFAQALLPGLISRRPIGVGLVVAAVLAAGFFCPATAGQTGVVRKTAVNMRSGPGTEYPTASVLAKGTRIEVLERIDGWLHVRIPGAEGFIRDLAGQIRLEASDTPAATGKEPAALKAIRKKAETIRTQIAEKRKDVGQYSAAEQKIADTLDAIDLNVETTRKAAASVRSQLDVVSHTIADTQAAIGRLNGRIRSQEQHVARGLVTLYKLGNLGPMPLLLSANSILDMVFRKNALERILVHDQVIRQAWVADRAREKLALERMQALKREKLDLDMAYARQIQTLNRDRARKVAILAEVRDKRSLTLALIGSLQQSARQLDATIGQLEASRPAETAEKKISGKSFTLSKGLLKMPVNGTVVATFGPYRDSQLKINSFRSGIDIRAKKGTPIRAVFSGRTIFASWFKGYGNLLIIDHGDSYYSVYAHAQELFKKKGDPVKAGEVIATVGDTGSLDGAKLYFELRRHGKPLDPMQWIKNG